MLQMKTSLKVCDKSGVGQVTCIGSTQKKKAFASLLRVILSKNSLKYKLLKKTNYLGICVKSRSWFFGIDGISKRHRANACLLLSKNFKLITGKAAGVWCKEILKQTFRLKKIFQNMCNLVLHAIL